MNFRYEVLTEAMKLQKMSFPRLEELSGTPESTLKKLARGETKDPRISTIFPPFKVLGLSIDRACGLAPERDMAKEAAVHNVSMVTALQERISMQDNKLAEYRTRILEQNGTIAAQGAKLEAREQSIAHRDQIIKDKERWLKIIVSAIAVVIVIDLLFANIGWFGFGPIR